MFSTAVSVMNPSGAVWLLISPAKGPWLFKRTITDAGSCLRS
jgi:hypothetical protein